MTWFQKITGIAQELNIPFAISGMGKPPKDDDGTEHKYVYKAAIGADEFAGSGNSVEEACEGAFVAYMIAQRDATEAAIKNLKKLQKLVEKERGKVLTFPDGAR